MLRRDATVFYQVAFRASKLNPAFGRGRSREAGDLLIQEVEFAYDRRPLAHFLERPLPGSDDDLGRYHVFHNSAESQTKSLGYVLGTSLL